MPASQPDQRAQLAQMMANRTRMPPMNPATADTKVAIPEQFQRREPPPPGWHPTPTAPFGGLGGTDWKQPGSPQETGYSSPGPDADYLQMLQLLGRRRFSPTMQAAAWPVPSPDRGM